MPLALLSLPRQALLLVVANAVTTLGSGLTAFGLDVWVYQQTGSYETFVLLSLASALPGLFFAPLGGVIADRYPRKHVLIVVELLAAAVVAALAVCHFHGALTPLLIGVANVLLSLAMTTSWPASAAAVTELTDNDEQRARINGVSETLGGAIMIASPLLGGLLMSLWGIDVLLLVDMLSYLAYALLLVLIHFPAAQAAPQPGAGEEAESEGFWRRISFGFRWIAKRRHLLTLLCFFALTNVGVAIVSVALAPYLMSFSAVGVFGLCVSMMGAGTIAGGMLFTMTGGMKRHEHGVLVGTLISAVAMVVLGLSRSGWALLACVFLMGACGPLVNASSQTIWQAEVPGEAQGRVFAIRRMIAFGLQPLSVLLSVPLLTMFVQPLVSGAGAVDALRAWWGEGQSGAIGLMISVCGSLTFVAAAVVLLLGGLNRPAPGLAPANEDAWPPAGDAPCP